MLRQDKSWLINLLSEREEDGIRKNADPCTEVERKFRIVWG